MGNTMGKEPKSAKVFNLENFQANRRLPNQKKRDMLNDRVATSARQFGATSGGLCLREQPQSAG
eukprot:10815948-Lingulodinium_polyedra.AAC.1